MDPIFEMLQKTPLWAGLDEQDLRLVVKSSKEQNFQSGQTVVRAGDPGEEFYLIVDGEVEVKSGGRTIARLGPGQFFGEMSVLDNQPRSADVITMKTSRILTLSGAAFKTLIVANPRIALKILHEFARRMRNTS